MKVKVQDLMTRECLACDPADSLATAALRMWEGDCGVLPVVDRGRVVSMITDRDICMALAFLGRPACDCAVAEVASGELWSCAPGDDVVAALATMGHQGVRRLPVLDDGRLAGILAINDLVTCSGENPDLREPILTALERICAHRDLPIGT
jgi:CBS domain-containing protein